MKKQHWYWISYSARIKNGAEISGDFGQGFDDKNITIKNIRYLKHQAREITQTINLVIISISYLGYMTEKEFKGEQIQK